MIEEELVKHHDKKIFNNEKSCKKIKCKKTSSYKKSTPKKWSKKVTETSDAMDLEKDIFKSKDPKKIAE